MLSRGQHYNKPRPAYRYSLEPTGPGLIPCWPRGGNGVNFLLKAEGIISSLNSPLAQVGKFDLTGSQALRGSDRGFSLSGVLAGPGAATPAPAKAEQGGGVENHQHGTGIVH